MHNSCSISYITIRYPLILIQELFLLGRWDLMDEWLSKAQNNASSHFLLHLLKVGFRITPNPDFDCPQSTGLKVREEGRDVKLANKLLREVDWEETLEKEEEEKKGEAKESLMQIVTDLNYLARELAKEDKEEARSILLKVIDKSKISMKSKFYRTHLAFT